MRFIILGFLGLVSLGLAGAGFMMFKDNGNLLGLLECVLCTLLGLWLFYKAIFKKRKITEDSENLRVTRDYSDGSYRGYHR